MHIHLYCKSWFLFPSYTFCLLSLVDQGMPYLIEVIWCGVPYRTGSVSVKYIVWRVYWHSICQTGPCSGHTDIVIGWHRYKIWYRNSIPCGGYSIVHVIFSYMATCSTITMHARHYCHTWHNMYHASMLRMPIIGTIWHNIAQHVLCQSQVGMT